MMRKIHNTYLEGYRPDQSELYRELVLLRRSFEKLIKLDGNSLELKAGLQHYEDFLKDNYDPVTIVDECRPYSPSSGRYMIWSNEVPFDRPN